MLFMQDDAPCTETLVTAAQLWLQECQGLEASSPVQSICPGTIGWFNKKTNCMGKGKRSVSKLPKLFFMLYHRFVTSPCPLRLLEETRVRWPTGHHRAGGSHSIILPLPGANGAHWGSQPCSRHRRWAGATVYVTASWDSAPKDPPGAWPRLASASSQLFSTGSSE